MTNQNYHSTAEHSYQEGRAFSWNRHHSSIWPWHLCFICSVYVYKSFICRQLGICIGKTSRL